MEGFNPEFRKEALDFVENYQKRPKDEKKKPTKKQKNLKKLKELNLDQDKNIDLNEVDSDPNDSSSNSNSNKKAQSPTKKEIEHFLSGKEHENGSIFQPEKLKKESMMMVKRNQVMPRNTNKKFVKIEKRGDSNQQETPE